MKAKAIIIFFFILAIPLCYIFYSGSSLSVEHKQDDSSKLPYSRLNKAEQIPAPDLGSLAYIGEIEKVNKSSGSKAALRRIIADVLKYGSLPDNLDGEKAMRLYHYISGLVSNIGSMDMEMHYFRNKLNRAPDTLSKMINLNKSLPSDRQWRLLPVKGSLYHMQGKEGEYNLKFVSPEGFCEAVYNKLGVLLKESNDPVNMGTFNYCAGMQDKDAHTKYDIHPYLLWGNSANSPQKGSEQIKDGARDAYEQYVKNASSVDAYRKRIMGLFSNGSQNRSQPLANPMFNPEEICP